MIKVDPSAHALAPVPLGDSAAVVVGEPVAAIGSPFGNENSLAVGVVSAVHRSIESLTSTYNLVDAIQTDAPINHGNSGGPLFDARGRVIGINAQIRSASGQAEGVGFAVPINSAKRSMQQLIANGSVAYAFVGVETTDLTPALARRFGYAVQRGAVVTNIVRRQPGRAGGAARRPADSSAFRARLPPQRRRDRGDRRPAGDRRRGHCADCHEHEPRPDRPLRGRARTLAARAPDSV